MELVIFNPRVGKALIIGQQFLPRGGHILIGGKGCHKCAETQVPDNHQIAANRIEEERGYLGDEVIEELDKEFAEIDFLADFKNPAQTLGKVGEFKPVGFVGTNVGGTANRLANMFGHPADILYPLLTQQIDAFLQFRDQISLQWIKRDGRQTHQRILNKDKGRNRNQNTALIQGEGKGLAKETAKRFGLGRDHRDDFALTGFAKMRQREPQYPFKQVITQPAQQSFGHHADIDVDEVFEPAIDENKGEKNPRQGKQIFDLIEFDPENVIGRARAADRFVDDQFGQVEGIIQKRK